MFEVSSRGGLFLDVVGCFRIKLSPHMKSFTKDKHRKEGKRVEMGKDKVDYCLLLRT